VLAIGCATVLSSCNEAVFDARGCPRLKGYTKAQMTQAADELDKAGPMLKRMMNDYVDTRDMIRACRGEKR
jgi:hypothetical protein